MATFKRQANGNKTKFKISRHMILEVAILNVIQGKEKQFEDDFKLAGQYISSIKGYVRHSLKKCIEQDNKYILLVDWETLEDHTIGFRTSEQYLEWKRLLHKYYTRFRQLNILKQ